jgi:hypothetical protein
MLIEGANEIGKYLRPKLKRQLQGETALDKAPRSKWMDIDSTNMHIAVISNGS